MNSEDFDGVVVKRLQKCESVLCSKNKEYSSTTDRLHNFKMAARINNTTAEQALWGMNVKHLVSVMDLVLDPSKATKEMIEEKITDSINYLLLLEALLTERLK